MRTENRSLMKRLLCLWSVVLTSLLLCGGLTMAQAQTQGNPQPAIVGTFGASNQGIISPDPVNAPGTQKIVSNLPADVQAHGVAYFGSDNALISDFSQSRVFVVQICCANFDRRSSGDN